MKVLVVDDEPTLLETVEMKLKREGYTTFATDNAEDAMRLYRRVRPDLLVLDIMLPGRSGLDLCRAIRKESQTPIIFITARSEDEDRIKGLEMGADDYLVKPFHLGELAARVRAVLRRSVGEPAIDPVDYGGLYIDPKTHTATLRGKHLDLAPKEFALLYFLARNPGQVFDRDTLLDRVWGRDAYVTARTIDVHIRWLRKHIEVDPDRPKLLLTVRGVGYKFAA
ncbi:MAG: response regulator transcription factor [Fimbriimonadaceae bacterium]|nr:MAG: Response regulator [Armatimonadetes bacterium OLB18]RIJ97604.1 MAG: DNA-binding response regulator [Armatimonadota bacterium]WKZ79246.1 MAG: response regulator transcription factor [Fimbriimonadaceae bacterium]